MRVNEAKELLKKLFAMKDTPAVMFWGAPGIGKSQMVKEICRELGWGMKDVRLLLCNPVDLRGVPVPNKEEKRADWLAAGFLPFADRDGEKGVLLLDEITAAPPTVQAAAYQLTLDKAVGDYRLPAGWKIVLAGNRVTDKGVVNRMPAPLANRMLHFEIEPELDDWKAWAYPAGIRPEVIAFLNFRNELLYKFPQGSEEIRAFPTPRTWEFVSSLLDTFGDFDAAYPAVVAAIGEGPAVELGQFIRMMTKLPDVDAILDGADVDVVNQPDILYALAGAIVGKVKANGTPKRLTNLMRFLAKIPMEFQVLTLRDVFKAGFKDALTKVPEFQKWAMANKNLIL